MGTGLFGERLYISASDARVRVFACAIIKTDRQLNDAHTGTLDTSAAVYFAPIARSRPPSRRTRPVLLYSTPSRWAVYHITSHTHTVCQCIAANVRCNFSNDCTRLEMVSSTRDGLLFFVQRVSLLVRKLVNFQWTRCMLNKV